MTERLDRLEALAETVLLAIQQQQQQINQNSCDIRDGINDVVGMIGTLAEQVQQNSNEIREIQAEIRGLQAENRNILAVLLNQQEE